jgi:cation diffusion facilitator family transporter
MVSVGVIISLVIVRLGWEQADGIGALLVAVAVFLTAWGILRGVLHTLGDAARLPADEVAVAACVVPDVVSCHGVRSRGARSHVYVDLHVQVAPGTTVERGHEITHEVEASLRRAYGQITDVVVHLEPGDFPSEWLGWPLTVDVEAKAKELAVIRLIADLQGEGERGESG